MLLPAGTGWVRQLAPAGQATLAKEDQASDVTFFLAWDACLFSTVCTDCQSAYITNGRDPVSQASHEGTPPGGWPDRHFS